MPGLFTILSKDKTKDCSDEINQIMPIVKHESFYKTGAYSNKELGLYIGYSVLSDTLSDCIPVVDSWGKVMLFFFGECFFDEKHSDNMAVLKHVIELYKKNGESCISELNGWFSGVIVDLAKSKTIIFNDKFGIQRLYCYENDGGVYIFSEAKALLKLFPQLRSMDMESFAEYICYDCVLNNRTFFKGIELMPNGSAWTYHNEILEKKKYFNVSDWENLPALSNEDYIEGFNATFNKIVSKYFDPNPATLALTGGIDTRMILAGYNPAPNTVPCVTFGGMYRNALDVRIAERVAAFFQQHHTIIPLNDSFLKNYGSNVQRAVYMTDGLVNVTNADAVYLNNAVRQISPIKVTGKFGSQVIKSLHGLRDRIPDLGILNSEIKPSIPHAKKTFNNLTNSHPLSFFLFTEIPWYWATFTAAEFTQVMVRSPYLDDDLIKHLYQKPKNWNNNYNLQIKFIEKYNKKLMSIMSNSGYGGPGNSVFRIVQKQYYKVLATMDKMYSWDIIPHNLTNKIAKVDYQLRHIKPLYFFRGFEYYRHYRTWFRDELSSFVMDITSDPVTLQGPFGIVKRYRIWPDHILTEKPIICWNYVKF